MKIFSKLFVLFGIVLLAGCISGPRIKEVSSTTRSYDFGEIGIREGTLTFYEIEGVDAHYFIAQVPFELGEFASFLAEIDSDTMRYATPKTVGDNVVYLGFSGPLDETPYMIFWHEGSQMLSVSTDAAVKDIDVMLELYEYYLDNL